MFLTIKNNSGKMFDNFVSFIQEFMKLKSLYLVFLFLLPFDLITF